MSLCVVFFNVRFFFSAFVVRSVPSVLSTTTENRRKASTHPVYQCSFSQRQLRTGTSWSVVVKKMMTAMDVDDTNISYSND